MPIRRLKRVSEQQPAAVNPPGRVIIGAWLQPENEPEVSFGRGRSRQGRPGVASRVPGAVLSVRTNAALSTPGNRLKGGERSYLERGMEPKADVLQDAPIEAWKERWSLWVSPSTENADGFVIARVLTEELGRRYGYSEAEVYVVEQRDTGRAHIHAVVPGRDGVKITSRDMEAIGRRIVKELDMELRLERVLERRDQRATYGGTEEDGTPWRAPTEAQKAMLARHGWFDPLLSRREASRVIDMLVEEQRARRSHSREHGRGRGM